MWFLLGSVVSKFETMLLLFTSTQENLEDILLAKKINRTSERIPTRLIKIKFNTPTIPEKGLCLNLSYCVELYIPPPKKCTQCKE